MVCQYLLQALMQLNVSKGSGAIWLVQISIFYFNVILYFHKKVGNFYFKYSCVNCCHATTCPWLLLAKASAAALSVNAATCPPIGAFISLLSTKNRFSAFTSSCFSVKSFMYAVPLLLSVFLKLSRQWRSSNRYTLPLSVTHSLAN